MAKPLPVGTAVRVRSAPALDGDPWVLSEPTTVAAVQFVTADGEISDEPQDSWQYLLDAEDPYPDIAVLPEYVVPV